MAEDTTGISEGAVNIATERVPGPGLEQEIGTGAEEVLENQDDVEVPLQADKNWAELQKTEYRGSLDLPVTLLLGALGGPTATILVGPTPGKRYEVPALMLCHRVQYFKKVFMGNFKEAREKILELPDMNFETFEVFLIWILTGNLQLPSGLMESDKNPQHDVTLLVDVVSWADRWLMKAKDDLMLKAMTELTKKLHKNIDDLTPQAIDVAFSSGSDDLKKVIAEYCVIPYVYWMTTNFEVDFPFEKNVSQTPGFLRYISAALGNCLRSKMVLVKAVGAVAFSPGAVLPMENMRIRLTGAELDGKAETLEFGPDRSVTRNAGLWLGEW